MEILKRKRRVCVQKTVETVKKIFNENGEITFGGWSRSPLFQYNKEAYPNQSKLVERDCYYISNSGMGFYLSVETVGNELYIRIVHTDFNAGKTVCDSISRKFMLEPKRLPESGSLGEFSYTDKKIALTLTNTVDGRYIKCDFIDFGDYKNLFVKVRVRKLEGESMNTIAPFDGAPRCFYLKRFVPKFFAEGVVRLGGTDYNLTEGNSFVYFDWSRYAFPRKQRFQQLSGTGESDGRKFSINLASKLGNNIKGSENCCFIDNRLIKIGRLKVSEIGKGTERIWRFESADGRVNLVFSPSSKTACKCEKLSVIFGELNGTVRDEDETVNIKKLRVHLISTNL